MEESLFKVVLNAHQEHKVLCWCDNEYAAAMITAALRNIDQQNTFTILEEHGTRINTTSARDAQDLNGDWEWTAFI